MTGVAAMKAEKNNIMIKELKHALKKMMYGSKKKYDISQEMSTL